MKNDLKTLKTQKNMSTLSIHPVIHILLKPGKWLIIPKNLGIDHAKTWELTKNGHGNLGKTWDLTIFLEETLFTSFYKS